MFREAVNVAPEVGLPQQTTEPSDFSAAKEPPKVVAWMATTFCSDPTELLSPPVSVTPQLTTRPSEQSAAREAPNMSREAWICVTSLNLSARAAPERILALGKFLPDQCRTPSTAWSILVLYGSPDS